MKPSKLWRKINPSFNPDVIKLYEEYKEKDCVILYKKHGRHDIMVILGDKEVFTFGRNIYTLALYINSHIDDMKHHLSLSKGKIKFLDQNKLAICRLLLSR